MGRIFEDRKYAEKCWTHDLEELVKLAQASLKNKRAELISSLKGFYSEHFRWLLIEAVQDLALLDRKL